MKKILGINNLLFLKIAFIILIIFTIFPAIASAKNINGKGYVNDQDIDKATTPKTAITITDSTVRGAWSVKNVGKSSITFTKATIDYAGFLPTREFSFSETLAPGSSNDGSSSLILPEFVLKLKGYYNIRVSGYDASGNVAISRTFWVTFGSGNPLTGVVGGIGTALAALAILAGIASVARTVSGLKAFEATDDNVKPRSKKGRWLRLISSVLMIKAAAFLIVAFGIVSALQTGAFIGISLASGIVTYLLTKFVPRLLIK